MKPRNILNMLFLFFWMAMIVTIVSYKDVFSTEIWIVSLLISSFGLMTNNFMIDYFKEKELSQ